MNHYLTVLFFALTFPFCTAQTLVTRGPYLQLSTPSSIHIKWRTNTAVPSRVLYGSSPSNLNQSVSVPGNRSEHDVRIMGLQPDTRYYYAIGSDQNILQSGSNLYFRTHPAAGSNRPVSLWVLGDCGTGSNDQRAVRNAFQNYMVGKPEIDGIILLGDNAYDFGTDGQYQDALFSNMYENIIANKVMWPCPGNHDYYSGADASTQSGPYYDIFTLPKAAENGGYPSGTEAYYSYDIGDVHFVSLDSHDSPRDSTGAQANWLKADLQQNTRKWTVVYWHHAPYTKGSHNSDNPFPFLDGELPQVREQLNPILERYGVDLVLCGHSHSYERSYLLNGHYGNSGSLSQHMILDNGSGNFDNSCPYRKNTRNGKAHKGTVYAVCGVAGKRSGTTSGWPHPAMKVATVDHFGSMLIQVNDNRLDARFITSGSQVFDSFTIIKNGGKKEIISICAGESAQLQPSFPANQYQWFPGNQTSTQGITVNPPFSTTYYGKDPLGCIRDTFIVQVIQPADDAGDNCLEETTATEVSADAGFRIYPNPLRPQQTLVIEMPFDANTVQQLYLTHISGQQLSFTSSSTGSTILLAISSNGFKEGIYLLSLHTKTRIYTHKIIVTP